MCACLGEHKHVALERFKCFRDRNVLLCLKNAVTSNLPLLFHTPPPQCIGMIMGSVNGLTARANPDTEGPVLQLFCDTSPHVGC